LSIALAGGGIDANTHLCVAFRLFRDKQRPGYAPTTARFRRGARTSS